MLPQPGDRERSWGWVRHWHRAQWWGEQPGMGAACWVQGWCPQKR